MAETDPTVEVLKSQMSDVRNDIGEIRKSIGELAKELQKFISGANFNWPTKEEMLREVSTMRDSILKEVQEVRTIAVTRSWLMGGAGIILGSTLTGLIVYFFSRQ